jgi:nucleotide-binding universal stress UspA family protein
VPWTSSPTSAPGTTDPPGRDRADATLVRTRALALDNAERDLALALPSVPVERFLLRGRAASAIVEEAKEFGADLVVVGHRGHGTIETMLLGSVSAEVVDHAPCPVLVARDGTVGTIVLADDGSPSAVTAAAALQALPLPRHTPVTVLSVTDTNFPFSASASPVLYDHAMSSYVQSLEEARADTKRIAEDGVQRLRDAGYRASPVVLEGDPAHEIVEYAANHGVGTLVLGTRGHTGLRRLLLGSVARNVLLHAPCSVLIVRENVSHRPVNEPKELVGAGVRD